MTVRWFYDSLILRLPIVHVYRGHFTRLPSSTQNRFFCLIVTCGLYEIYYPLRKIHTTHRHRNTMVNTVFFNNTIVIVLFYYNNCNIILNRLSSHEITVEKIFSSESYTDIVLLTHSHIRWNSIPVVHYRFRDFIRVSRNDLFENSRIVIVYPIESNPYEYFLFFFLYNILLTTRNWTPRQCPIQSRIDPSIRLTN